MNQNIIKDSSRLYSLIYQRYLQIKRQGIIIHFQHHSYPSKYAAQLQCNYKDIKKLQTIVALPIGLQICDMQGKPVHYIKSTDYQIQRDKKQINLQKLSTLYILKTPNSYKIKYLKYDQYILVKSNPTIGILKNIYQQKIDKKVKFYPKLQDFIDGKLAKIDLNQDQLLGQYNYQSDLNQDQNNAIKKVFENHITFIKGPPGCGKTKTISRMIKLLASQGKKIIVGSVSNIANYSLIHQLITQIQEQNYLYYHYHNQIPSLKYINLCINFSQVAQQKLSSIFPQFIHYSINYQLAKIILKISQNNFYTQDNIMEYIYRMKRNQQIQNTFYAVYMKAMNLLISKVDVMISTTINSVKINTGLNYNCRFRPDVGILDQAAQASWGDGYIFLALGIKRLILVGDQKQLAPTVIGDSSTNKILKQTMFENLSHINQDYFIQLSIQYRMHPEIVQFTNINIYNGKLKNGQTIQKFNSDIQYFKHFPISFLQHNYQQSVQLVSTSSNENFQNQNQNNNLSQYIRQYYNKYQASLIIQFLSIFPASQLKNTGIITFYDRQNQFLIQNLQKYIELGLTIKTIDGYQGGQKDYIIVSTVRCNSLGKVGFCAQQNRFNVALTRAKKGLIVFGNPYTLMEGRSYNNLDQNIWGKFYQYMYQKQRIFDIEYWRQIIENTKVKQNYQKQSQNINIEEGKQNQRQQNKQKYQISIISQFK